jgi:hypothetical protein
MTGAVGVAVGVGVALALAVPANPTRATRLPTAAVNTFNRVGVKRAVE